MKTRCVQPTVSCDNGDTVNKPRSRPGVPRAIHSHLRFYLGVLSFTVTAHICVMAYADPLHSDDLVKHFLAISFQVLLLVGTLMSFLLMASRTMFVRVGLYERFFKEFKWTFLLFFAALASFAASKAVALVMVIKKEPYLELWKSTGYILLYILQRLVMVLYYGFLVNSSFQILHDDMYTANCLDVTR